MSGDPARDSDQTERWDGRLVESLSGQPTLGFQSHDGKSGAVEGPSYLFAVEAATGSNLWKQERPALGSFTSPAMTRFEGQNQILVTSNGDFMEMTWSQIKDTYVVYRSTKTGRRGIKAPLLGVTKTALEALRPTAKSERILLGFLLGLTRNWM